VRPVILYRGREFEENEESTAEEFGFFCTDSRMQIRKDDLVIGRYSVLPFYEEQERDLKMIGANLINTYQQHRYIADIKNWYEDLKELTPKTWFRLVDIPDTGPFVLKGETNSQKFLWDELMFAEDKKRAIEIYCKLKTDSLLQYQDIAIRKFVPLKTHLTGLRGLPITNEWRFFTLYGRILSVGYYWSSYIDEVEEKLGHKPGVLLTAYDLVNKALSIIGDKANAVVIDVAETESGEPIIIELNDLQMSGLSENHPASLYPNLYTTLREHNERNRS